MKKAFTWFFMLNKRLYKRLSFLLIILLIPISVVAVNLVAKQESGALTIAIASEEADCPIFAEIKEELKWGTNLLKIVEYEKVTDAIDSVENGSSDGAWIFPENIQEAFEEFAENPTESNSVVKVYEREQNVATRLSHEKITGVLYPYVSREFYLNFFEVEKPIIAPITEEKLLSYYENFDDHGKLFSVETSKAGEKHTVHSNYLLSPIRGLLAIISVICGIASAAFYVKDKQSGTFSLIREEKRLFLSWLCQFITVLNVSIVMLLGLVFSGLGTTLFREFTALVLFILSTTFFCTLVGQLLVKIQWIGTSIPILAVAMIAVCPVFFDLSFFKSLQFLFPPTYYINGVYNNNYLIYSVIYILITSLATLLIDRIKLRIRK